MEQIHAVRQVDRYIHQRRATDQRFVSWPVYYFLLRWVTLGIYAIVIFYRRLKRADLFRDRQAHYTATVITATRQFTEQHEHYGAARDDLNDLWRFMKERFEDEHKPIKAGASLALSFLTLGIYGFYATYRTMRFWWEIQLTEQDFYDQLGTIWAKLGMINYPVTLEVNENLHRSFGIYLFLTIITLGIFWIVWDYRMHTDPEKIYPEFHSAEDGVLGALRTINMRG